MTLSLTLPANYIGEEVEVVAFIKKEGMKEIEMLSPALPDSPLSNKEFQNWITKAEEMPSVSLSNAKAKWLNKRKQLQKLIPK